MNISAKPGRGYRQRPAAGEGVEGAVKPAAEEMSATKPGHGNMQRLAARGEAEGTVYEVKPATEEKSTSAKPRRDYM